MYSGSTTGLPKISPLLLDGVIFESVIFESVKYVANLAMEPLFRKSILTVLIHDAKRFEGLNAQLRLGGSAEIFDNRSVQQKKCKNFINTGILYCFKEQVNPRPNPHHPPPFAPRLLFPQVCNVVDEEQCTLVYEDECQVMCPSRFPSKCLSRSRFPR